MEKTSEKVNTLNQGTNKENVKTPHIHNLPYTLASSKNNKKRQYPRLLDIPKRQKTSTSLCEALNKLLTYVKFLKESGKKKIRYIKEP